MASRQDFETTRNHFLGSLREAHDYFFHTRMAWKIIDLQAKSGLNFKVKNLETNSSVELTEMVLLSRGYINRELMSATIQQFVEIFERYLFEIARLCLRADLEKLGELELKGKEIIFLSDKNAIIEALIEKKLHNLSYGRPAEWFKQFNSFTKIGIPNEADREQYSEIKATRDILVHGGGIINRLYLDKAGSAARGAIGDAIQLSESYHLESWKLIHRLTREIGDALVAKSP